MECQEKGSHQSLGLAITPPPSMCHLAAQGECGYSNIHAEGVSSVDLANFRGGWLMAEGPTQARLQGPPLRMNPRRQPC